MNIYRQGVKTHGIVIVFDEYEICDRVIAIAVTKQPDAFKYLRDEFRKNEKIAGKAVECYQENEQSKILQRSHFVPKMDSLNKGSRYMKVVYVLSLHSICIDSSTKLSFEKYT